MIRDVLNLLALSAASPREWSEKRPTGHRARDYVKTAADYARMERAADKRRRKNEKRARNTAKSLILNPTVGLGDISNRLQCGMS